MPSGKIDVVDLRLDVVPGQLAQRFDFDLVVEVADVADDGPVASSSRMWSIVMTSVLPVALTKMSPPCRSVVHGDHLVAFHRRLQRADRVDLGDHDAAPSARSA